MQKFIMFIYVVFICATAIAQPSLNTDSTNQYQQKSKLNTSSQKLVKSISENKTDEEIAEDYYTLAQELINKAEYEKAEMYLNKAIEQLKNKKKNKRLGVYYRELARIQEIQKKTKDAAHNYDMASKYSTDKNLQRINANDAERMRKPDNRELELQNLNQNVQLQTNTSDAKSRAQTYTQIAEVNRAMNQPEQAMINYNNALTDFGNNSPEAINIKSGMASLLTETENYEQALVLQKEVIEQSQKVADISVQTQQLRQLSDIYFKNKSITEGIKVLQDAYVLAKENGSVKEARATLDAIISFYEKTNQDFQILPFYRDFVFNIENIISKDSSLIDAKLFQITEEKLSQLEKEKTLKDELIKRKNRNNIMLVIFIAALIALLLLIVRGWFSIRKNNKRIALQSLRREMNPHFIFNSLNSVNQFIANNNEMQANKYLTAYSNLMRNVMENSNKDYVSLATEVEQLKKYLELEKLRFPSAFEYTITIDPVLDTESLKIPNMLIQPNIENAIWHGLRYKESMGELSIEFKKENIKTTVIIEDNGIGITKSREIKTPNQKLHDSRGLKNIEERIKLLNEIYNTEIKFEISEKTGIETGVVVKITW